MYTVNIFVGLCLGLVRFLAYAVFTVIFVRLVICTMLHICMMLHVYVVVQAYGSIRKVSTIAFFTFCFHANGYGCCALRGKSDVRTTYCVHPLEE